MENVICPNCGFQFPLDKSRDFCFCLKCGTKIEVPKYEEIQPEVQKVKPTEQPEVKNKTPKNEPKSKVDSALEEVEFYYDTSFNKKEYADTENQPTYYLKAQDLLIDLSTEFETDWRIWWEVSKPIDYKCTEFTEECRPYTVNDMYFQRAVDYAPIEQKKELIKLGDEYKERKEKFFKKFDEQAEKRKAEEKERLEKEKAEKERLEKEKAEKEKAEKERLEKEKAEKEKAEKERLEKEKVEKAEAEKKKAEEEKQKKEQEEKQKEEGTKQIAVLNPQLYVELAGKNYDKVDGGYFTTNNANGEKIFVALRVVSKMMYLIGFREAASNNALYCDQSMTVKFNAQGDIVDFGNRPIMFLPDNGKLNISYVYTGDLSINDYKLDINADYVDQLMKNSKKAFIKSKIFK